MVCRPDGSGFQVIEPCVHGCNEVVDCFQDCAPGGQPRCDGNRRVSCSENGNELVEACVGGCLRGECQGGNVPLPLGVRQNLAPEDLPGWRECFSER